MRTIEQMIQAEVLVCLSALVSNLAEGYGMSIAHHGKATSLESLTEQAFELASPVPDYEEAAVQAGWVQDAPDALWVIRDGRDSGFTAQTAEQACELDDIEPYDREVFEHWAVTDWFADKLIAVGEKVDKDFAGMCVWARTTSGQGIASDGVIERIYAELAK